MSRRAVGYEFLRNNLRLRVLPGPLVSEVRPTTRVEQITPELQAIPGHVAPKTDKPLEHLIFALKHEGVDLAILADALPSVDPADLVAAIREAPTGRYSRLLGYLWESFTGRVLDDLPAISGPTEPLFDPDLYFVGPARRDPKWRVSFNGIGSLRYCATLRKTAALTTATSSKLMERAEAFLAELESGMQERAVEWAYLSETQSTFAIEQEMPSESKARKFMRLLHSAHDKQPLSEEYLVELQNVVISNALDQAVEFRNEQNYLTSPGRGPSSVTYVPPPAALCRELMGELITIGNELPTTMDSILLASVVKFGFTFLHPFMDGNGRLSRFLFHKTLCATGDLKDGRLLPVSVAMKRHEDQYLEALRNFSKPARRFWSVQAHPNDLYECQFEGSPSLYRYWDATISAEFSYRMAEQTLEVDLRQETEFLERFDRVYRHLNDQFDVRNPVLNTLVLSALQNGGRASGRRRKQFELHVPKGFFEALEAAATAAIDGVDPVAEAPENGLGL